ncbi:DoxX family protein [Runella aurantiaca]|uniref:DoxX family protein n=1 Tax=Runella aurantiaca TaxID=2282308 RepID=A0A369HYY8_9BACT|nr:DoxX family protein [Runella aurantiaca]RDB02751.1 DoxX family protein [Runella aurantiaca]
MATITSQTPIGSHRLYDIALLTVRIGISLMMLTHGLPKLELLLSDGGSKFPSVGGMSPALTLGLTVFSEFVCSLLLIFGLFTRFALAALAFTMFVAALVVHAADDFSVKEMSLHYLLVYSMLLLTGGGRFSIDHWWKLERNKKSINS